MTELEQQLTQALEQMSADLADGMLALSQRLDELEQHSRSRESQQQEQASVALWLDWQREQLAAWKSLAKDDKNSFVHRRLTPACVGCKSSRPLLQMGQFANYCTAMHRDTETTISACASRIATTATDAHQERSVALQKCIAHWRKHEQKKQPEQALGSFGETVLLWLDKMAAPPEKK